MTHFAIPNDEFPPLGAEDEPVSGVDDAAMLLSDGIEPLGLSLIPRDLSFTILIFAVTAGVDVGKWWSR